MTADRSEADGSERSPGAQRAIVRLPGFIADSDIGLGDALKRITRAVGMTPCGGCNKRAASLNRWVSFRGNEGRNGPA